MLTIQNNSGVADSRSSLRDAASHVLTSDNPKTLAAGTVITIAGVCLGLVKLGMAALEIIGGTDRR